MGIGDLFLWVPHRYLTFCLVELSTLWFRFHVMLILPLILSAVRHHLYSFYETCGTVLSYRLHGTALKTSAGSPGHMDPVGPLPSRVADDLAPATNTSLRRLVIRNRRFGLRASSPRKGCMQQTSGVTMLLHRGPKLLAQ